jgi:hypothetical protein
MKVLVLRMFLGLAVVSCLSLTNAVAQPVPETTSSISRPANAGGETVSTPKPASSETKPAAKEFVDMRTKTSLPVMGRWGKSKNDFADCVQQL